MSLQPIEVLKSIPNWPHNIILIVDTGTDLPLPISIYEFTDWDEAESFLQWCTKEGKDPRQHEAPIENWLDAWRLGYGPRIQNPFSSVY